MAPAYGQRPERRRIDGIGRYDERVATTRFGARYSEDEQPLGPLRKTDDTPLKEALPAAAESGDALGRQLKQYRLTAFVTRERGAQRGHDGAGEPKRIDRAQMRGRGAMDGSRAHAPEPERREAHRARAPQPKPPRRSRVDFRIEVSQRSAALKPA